MEGVSRPGAGAPRGVVVVHGGAGFVPPERRDAHLSGVRDAAATGREALAAGATSLEAAIVAVEQMEANPIFNAGCGSSLNERGEVELDASVMCGATRLAGAVAALVPFPSAIRVAEAVMNDGRHVLYAGEGATVFAERSGFERLAPDALTTDRARERLEAQLAGRVGEGWAGGTVGAVVADAAGQVAAATSTGGTVGKAPGRVGDTPLIGAGTYADDLSCAVSATGVGEGIMRASLASRIAFSASSPEDIERATAAAMEDFAERFDGSGGVIVVTRQGLVVVKWNTVTMSHAIAREGEDVICGI
ncbi:MAG: isoaspartyl peptidase/L-asparaginase [Deltaproteobacteria bacterium]|nr:isoaspartyl peptidase/L-asparaginase [Deltaproteobacteria bacterium]